MKAKNILILLIANLSFTPYLTAETYTTGTVRALPKDPVSVTLPPQVTGGAAPAAGAAPQGSPAVAGPLKINGIPKLVRTNPNSEVFFYDINGSFVIPQAMGHNRIFNALIKAQNERKAIGILVDPKTNNVIGLENDSVSVPAPVGDNEDDYWVVSGKKDQQSRGAAGEAAHESTKKAPSK